LDGTFVGDTVGFLDGITDGIAEAIFVGTSDIK
jgi:hypothetical protein